MLLIRLTLIFLLLPLIFTACIKSYQPEITGSDVSKYVVSGQITNLNSIQTVTISMTSSINELEAIPVTGCTVIISDDQGHEFPMIYSENGNYTGQIDQQYLIPGNSFKVDILTSDGDKIVSDYDHLSSSPAIDSIYFIRKDLSTADPSKPLKGIQFYIDLKGDVTDSKFYRFEVFETWEYHSEYPVEWFFAGKIQRAQPADYSLSICWSTFRINNIYALTTGKLSENKYKLFPLNFVDNRTDRLVYGYSLLVNQYSLSEDAYIYWNQLRINSTSQGGLYERQPLAVKGNLRNLTHPDQEVLGFFGVSSVTTKRIFVRNVENLEMENTSRCAERPLLNPQFQLYNLDASFYPVYLKEDSAYNPTIILDKGCVDCRAYNGTTVKPDFWPW